jgi:hypothetical protein
MPKVSPLQSNFSGGEFSPLLYGRVDAERYQSALAVCENYIPTIQGGLIRRSGNYFVAEVKSSSAKTRLVSFEFSTTQAYIIEFGNLYLRFYKDNGQITLASQAISGITNANPAVVTYVGADTYANGDEVYITGIVGAIGTYLNGRNFKVAGVDTGANTFQLTYMDGTNVNSTSMGSYSSAGTIAEVYTVTTTYATADLFQLKFTQSADTLYITHPSYPPKKLTRTAHTTWTITTIDFLDGPYLTTNTTATTLTPSAATGAGVTLTASAVTGINGDAGFATTDVGRLIRIKEGSVWGYVKITGWTSTTVVTVTVINTLTNTGAKTAWRMGLHEDRLFFAGNTNQPQRLDGSKSGDYENFAPTATDGTIAADNAVSYALNANTVNVIRWMISDEKGLLAGTVGGEWSIRATTTGEALSPTNINAKPATAYGSANIQPVQVGKSAIFVQRAGKKIREMTYFYDVDGFRAPDLTVLSEHITGTGVSEIAYQKEPQSIVWSVRNDGVLVGMTYERDLDSLKVGWSRHVVGGYSDAANSDAVVESVAVIPAADGTRDEVWMIVKRYVNGGVKRYIEYMTAFFEDNIEQKDAFFVDSGLTYDAPLTITGITQANPAVVTSNGHLLSNGNVVLLSGVKGMTEVNGETFTVANAAANTFELTGINSTAYTTYVSGGEIRKYITTVSGLWHLEGQSVSILGDGAVQPNATVANGSVTLTQRATTVQVGLGYNSDGQMLRLEAGSADGTALGKTRRTHRVGILLHRSLGLKIGMSFTDLDTITFRTSSDPLSRAVPLYSGILSENIEANYDFENQFCWRQDQPLPSLILAVAPQMVTMDR